MLFGLRTTIGQEKVVVEVLEHKASKQNAGISALASVPGLKGYLIVEASNEADLRKLVYRAPHVRGIVSGGIQVAELEHFFEVKPLTTGIERGDIVELTSGAFKGERARVIRVDEGKEKITVEIIEAAVPIPVTVEAAGVRLLQKANEAAAEKK
ncbi:transcription elongation factor Spt5 [Candidatus Micrarchaeota archaeon]|nr:transcription elongation factor Spt5 [Candidatus Micrarchaeota archaeon]